jgi:hypothetical protein
MSDNKVDEIKVVFQIKGKFLNDDQWKIIAKKCGFDSVEEFMKSNKKEGKEYIGRATAVFKRKKEEEEEEEEEKKIIKQPRKRKATSVKRVSGSGCKKCGGSHANDAQGKDVCKFFQMQFNKLI